MHSLTSVLLFLMVISTAYCHQYTVSVNLGNYPFAEVEGSLKMKIYGPHSSDTFRLIRTTLRQGAHYQSTLEINYPLPNINKVSVYFTLTNPLDPRYLFKKPTIYLKEIVISSDELIFSRNQRIFKPANPARAIKLKEEVFLNLIAEF